MQDWNKKSKVKGKNCEEERGVAATEEKVSVKSPTASPRGSPVKKSKASKITVKLFKRLKGV